ncbi:membrane protein insertion efficiency factor YidD [Cellulomonas endophytica]|uniref:membrane protein insertion efficiency factor YidD n=1 Tax=Cellulomonas endophytica TaxID=2494735 RepID=UPI001F0CC009|nr:membrane protein insertion efficiency factor YidD [Cellulomonas endophytica]
MPQSLRPAVGAALAAVAGRRPSAGPRMDGPGVGARIADGLVAGYQRRVSPHKGWSCAHRVAHGGDSCSGAVRGFVRRRGLRGAVAPTVARFVACAAAARLLQASDVRGVCCCGPIPIPFRF